MPSKSKQKEINRLINAFEVEASKFHELTFSIEYLSEDKGEFSKPIAKKHHGIMLWQLYGSVDGNLETEKLVNAITKSDLNFGIPGAKLTCIGIIEGALYEVFVRMASRAGSLFDKDELQQIKTLVSKEVIETEAKRNPNAKVVGTTNDHPLAIWLNYLLYHLSQTNPGREHSRRIEPDPFALSLLALERLNTLGSIEKMEPSVSRLTDIKFKVALSFPGERRDYVEKVARHIQSQLGENSVFYDNDYQAHLARPNLDILLQNIYWKQTDLVVVFLCEKYAEKEWCGLEWRAIRDLIKSKKDHQIIFVRFDEAFIDGVFGIDGYLDANKFTPEEIGDMVCKVIPSHPRI